MEDEEILDLLWNRQEKGLKELENKYGKQIERLAERIQVSFTVCIFHIR